MAKLPYIQFFPADYLRDTRCLSLAARGVWMDVLCTLWNAPKRGQKTLTLEGWAGEVGKPESEVSALLLDLESNGIGKFIHETDGKLTIISRRMIRDERERKGAAKRKQYQRDRSESRNCHTDSHANVTGIYQKSYIRSQNQKSEEEKKEERKNKSCGQVKTVPAIPKSSAAWTAYEEAYRTVYGVDPVRNQQANALMCRLVDKLGAEEAPAVAAFYLSHRNPFYVAKRHPPNLLVQDAEGLRTQWITGCKATRSEIKQAELKDDAREQVKRVEAMLTKGGL